MNYNNNGGDMYQASDGKWYPRQAMPQGWQQGQGQQGPAYGTQGFGQYGGYGGQPQQYGGQPQQVYVQGGRPGGGAAAGVGGGLLAGLCAGLLCFDCTMCLC